MRHIQNRLCKILFGGLPLLVAVLPVESCIDEDLSKCPSPCTDITIRYVIEQKEKFDPAFACDVRSLHTGFWASDDRLYVENVFGEQELPDSVAFEMTFPADDYGHIATVNCEDDGGRHALFPDDKRAVCFKRACISPDTIRAMSRATFWGRFDINLSSDPKTEYVVPLYPMVGKMELTLRHVPTLSNIRCYIGNTKAGFMCWTGEWIENGALITDATALAEEQPDGSKQFAFYVFPTVGQKAAARQKATEGEWKLYFLSDCTTTGKTVQHVYTIKQPLMAGEVFRGTFSITETGGEHGDVEAGLEVDTDWNDGNDHEMEM